MKNVLDLFDTKAMIQPKNEKDIIRLLDEFNVEIEYLQLNLDKIEQDLLKLKNK
jgi:hypothetical protein